TVHFATADGTATAADSDYQPTGGDLSFVPGATTQFVTVQVNGDTTSEPNETFFVNLSSPSNATLAPSTGTGTIPSDDAATPQLSINAVAKSEGNAGTTDFVFTVSLSAPVGQAVTVDVATADGSAVQPGDYTAVGPATLTFDPGETTRTVTVLVNGDTDIEPN